MAWPREPPASSMQAGLRKQLLQNPKHWSPRHSMARQDMCRKHRCKARPDADTRTCQEKANASTRHHLGHCHRRAGQYENSPIGRCEKSSRKDTVSIWEGAAPWYPGGGQLGSKSSTKRPVEATRRGNMAASEPVRRWHHQQQKQPRTCTHAPSSHPTADEAGPFSS